MERLAQAQAPAPEPSEVEASSARAGDARRSRVGRGAAPGHRAGAGSAPERVFDQDDRRRVRRVGGEIDLTAADSTEATGPDPEAPPAADDEPPIRRRRVRS